MPKISIFNGGLHTSAAPHLIADKESVVNLNMDHISGMITPLLDKTEAVLNAEKWGHFFTTELAWYFSPTPKDWVEFQERLYIGNRTGFSTKIVGANEWLMGIVGPTVIPTGVASNEAISQNQITNVELFANTNPAPVDPIPAETTQQYRVVNITAGGSYYPSDKIFKIYVESVFSPGDPEYHENDIRITVNDTNFDTTIAIFRLFDNYWRLVYEGSGTVVYDTILDISANASIEDYLPSGLDGVYQYALTWYNTVDDTESVPVISEEITVANGTITVSNLEVPVSDPQINQKRLYRIGGGLTAFAKVAELAIATVSYVDSIADDQIDGTLLDSQENYPPPTNIQWMTEAYSMLFAADGDKLRFTPIGLPNYWPQTYFLDFPRTITGIAKTQMGVLVFNQFETWLVTGTGPLSLAQQPLTGSQGCINGDTVVNIDGAAYWASTDGICLSNGGQVQLVTRGPLSKLDLSGSVNAVVYDEQYHLLTDTGSYILDLGRSVIKNTQYNIESYIVANDILYGYINSALHEIESSVTPLPLVYRSPEYIGAAFSVPKIYKNIYVFSEGELTASVYIDKVLVQTSVLDTTYGNHQFKIPDIASKGHSIQFEISGTGTVYEIQWMDGNANQ